MRTFFCSPRSFPVTIIRWPIAAVNGNLRRPSTSVGAAPLWHSIAFLVLLIDSGTGRLGYYYTVFGRDSDGVMKRGELFPKVQCFLMPGNNAVLTDSRYLLIR